MTVKIVDDLDRPLLEEAWALYHAAFEELNELAVQRHLMTRPEFDGVMADRRVRKYLCYDTADLLVGLSAYTNDLEAVPLISPAYFRRHHPAEYAAGQVWYCEFVAVLRSGRDQPGGGSAFAELVEAMWADGRHGVIALDMCRVNADLRGMARVVPLMLHRLAGNVVTKREDEQSYWLYEFPRASG